MDFIGISTIAQLIKQAEFLDEKILYKVIASDFLNDPYALEGPWAASNFECWEEGELIKNCNAIYFAPTLNSAYSWALAAFSGYGDDLKLGEDTSLIILKLKVITNKVIPESALSEIANEELLSDIARYRDEIAIPIRTIKDIDVLESIEVTPKYLIEHVLASGSLFSKLRNSYAWGFPKLFKEYFNEYRDNKKNNYKDILDIISFFLRNVARSNDSISKELYNFLNKEKEQLINQEESK